MVKVLPEPVTPSSTWSRSFPCSPATRSRMAVGWSPFGSKGETTWRLRAGGGDGRLDRKSTRLNSSHANISYAVFCLKKKKYHKTNYCRKKHLKYLMLAV